jgi:hypothetical protein
MPGTHGWKVWLPALLASGALLSTCQLPGPGVDATSATAFAGDPESLLPGTWLREYQAKGVVSRHILVLGPDHHFRESVRVVDATGQSASYVHEGTWLFDGTNLKRKYTVMNGKPPSRLNLPFATFQITFDSPREFRGVDHIHRNEIDYRRVADDTQP